MITIYSKMLENKFVFDAFVSTFKNKQIVQEYTLLILEYMPWLNISVYTYYDI